MTNRELLDFCSEFIHKVKPEFSKHIVGIWNEDDWIREFANWLIETGKLRTLEEKIEGLRWKCDEENGCGYDGRERMIKVGDKEIPFTQAMCGGPVTGLNGGATLHEMIKTRNQTIEAVLELFR